MTTPLSDWGWMLSNAMDPDADDWFFALAISNYLLARPGHGTDVIYLGINHNIRTAGRWKTADAGPCPLRYDWVYKTQVGIQTRDRAAAQKWIMDALLLGYNVYRRENGSTHNGGGVGTIADVRKRLRARSTQQRQAA